MSEPQSMMEWALLYASMGVPVFPCHAFDPSVPQEYGDLELYDKKTPEHKKWAKPKTPATTHGCNDASTDEKQIRAWWDKNPSYNIGFLCGAGDASLLVFDLDRHDEKADGIKAFEQWQKENGDLPKTREVYTPTGGRHLYYRAKNQTSTNKPSLGIDIRATGGYVLAPPSVHPNGDVYEWSDDDLEEPAKADDTALKFAEWVRDWSAKGKGDAGKARADAEPTYGTTHFDSDEELLSKATQSGNGAKFKSLWDGTDGNPDHSAGDFALMCSLAFWSNRDPNQMRRMFLQAPRTKSNKRTGVELDKYIERTIRKAAIKVSATYQGNRFWGKRKDGTKSATFLHEVMGDYLIKEMHACLIDGAPAVWDADNGVYRISTESWERAIISSTRGSTPAHWKNVTEYMKRVAPRLDPRKGACYIACRNGWVNPFVPHFGELDDEGRYIGFYAPSTDICVTNLLPITWNPSAYDDQTNVWLDSYCTYDGMRQNLEEVFAMCIYRGDEVKQAAWCIGSGGDGKTTFIKVLERFVGDDNLSSIDIDDMDGQFDLSGIVGKIANIGDEQNTSTMNAKVCKLYKKMTGGSKVRTEAKYQSKFDVRPYCSHVYSLNAFPKLYDTSIAMYDRLHAIGFNKRFRYQPDEVHNYDVILDNDNSRSYLLNLALKRLPDIVRRGRYLETEFSRQQINDVMLESDSFMDFASDYQRSDIIGRMTTDVYDWYTDFCTRWKAAPVNHRAFSRRIGKMFNVRVVKDGPTINGTQMSMYRAK